MNERFPSIRKAAILIASLDDRTAETLLEQMSPEHARLIRDELVSMGHADPAEQRSVIEEFFRIGPLVPSKMSSGIELDGPLARQLTTPPVPPPAPAQWPPAGPAERRPVAAPAAFRFLEDAALDEAVRYLQREQPQTIAVVVSQLAPERAAVVLSALPAALRGEVAVRLVHLDATDPEIVREIERGMQSWMAEQTHRLRRRAVGLEALRGILAAAEPGDKHTILNSLAAHDRRLAGKLQAPSRRPQWTIADVEQLDDERLRAVVRRADGPVLMLALTGAAGQLVERILRLMPASEALVLRRALDNPGPLRLSDVERAQQELAALASRLEPSNSGLASGERQLSIAV